MHCCSNTGQKTTVPANLKGVSCKEMNRLPRSDASVDESKLDHAVQVIRNAKLWCDVESAEEADQLSDLWEWTLVPGFTASKILWLKNKEPDNFARLRQVLLPHDFFNYHLTGRYVMEVSR